MQYFTLKLILKIQVEHNIKILNKVRICQCRYPGEKDFRKVGNILLLKLGLKFQLCAEQVAPYLWGHHSPGPVFIKPI